MTAGQIAGALDIGIVTANGPDLVAFYRDVLGFSDLGSLTFPGSGVVHRLSCGASILRIFVPDLEPPVDCRGSDDMLEASGLRYLTLRIPDIASVVQACEASGVRVPLAPVAIRPGVLAAQVRDPDGNWIELMEGT